MREPAAWDAGHLTHKEVNLGQKSIIISSTALTWSATSLLILVRPVFMLIFSLLRVPDRRTGSSRPEKLKSPGLTGQRRWADARSKFEITLETIPRLKASHNQWTGNLSFTIIPPAIRQSQVRQEIHQLKINSQTPRKMQRPKSVNTRSFRSNRIHYFL